jgi:hypothetical protein
MTDFENAVFRAGIALWKSAKPEDCCGFRWFDPPIEFRDYKNIAAHRFAFETQK